ncbi:MAG: UvrD-helicase domain-containing protein [FCB group bacterium]|nr:UvrD-helicase domain-containing protein [FCB group bacterium]
MKLNDTQRQAVEANGYPVLIFAGAGSGKTRVLTHKIAYLIKEGIVAPEHILAVTFTNKAAREMKERALKLLGNQTVSLSIGTFHSISARLLRKEIHRLGFTSDYAIYDVQDQVALLKIILDTKNVSKDYLSPQTIQRTISLCKNTLITPEMAERKAKNIRERTLAELYEAYQQELKRNNALDFDDLLLKPLEIFDNFPSVLKRYQKQWQYILVDEYQDTNRPQFLFVSKLAESHGQICVVGDDDQSIYSWRGADIQNILNFEKIFSKAQTFTLAQNYRSTQEILTAASSVVRNNVNRQDKELVAASGKGELLGLIETNDEQEEADAIISALRKEIKLNKRSFRDFAVLYRTNAQSRALEDSFRRMGIPYNIVGGIRFYDRKEIKDVLGYLKLIVNPQDTIALRRVINFPPRGIGLKTVDKCVRQAEEAGSELFDILEDPSKMQIRGKQAESLKGFYELIQKYRSLLNKLDAAELTSALAEEAGVLNYFKTADTPEDHERRDNVLELMNSVESFVKLNPEAGIPQFLEEVSLLTDIDTWEDKNNRVTLMTLHAAKGLEFPIVFIAGLEDGLFPLYNALNDPNRLEEERRLFYVGVTRARQRVYLLYATQRRRMGAEYNPGLVSRFIREIPEELMERISFTSALTRKVVSTKLGATKVKVSRSITDFDDFQVGDYVEHAIFGIGKIMALSGSGENQRVGVVFKDGLKKKLIVKYANLKKIQSPN